MKSELDKARMSPRGQILELNGLRAIAVCAVIGFHYAPPNAPLFTLGWVGVDLFFVISGYLITSILLRSVGRPLYFRNFYIRRCLRIFPPYYLVLSLLFILCVATVPHPSAKLWLSYATLSITAYNISGASWLVDANRYPLLIMFSLSIMWSLSVEELFYLLWAPLVRFVSARRLRSILVVVCLLVPFLRLWLSAYNLDYYRWFPARLDCLAYGALVAITLNLGDITACRAWFAMAMRYAFPIGFIAFLALGSEWGHPPLIFTLVAAIFFILVGWCVTHSGSNSALGRILRTKPFQRVGRVSYMMYLIHGPVIIGLAAFNRALLAWFASVPGSRSFVSDFAVQIQTVAPPGHLGHPLLTVAILVMAFGMTLGLAELSWHYFEAPILALKEKWAPSAGERFTTAIAKAASTAH